MRLLFKKPIFQKCAKTVESKYFLKILEIMEWKKYWYKVVSEVKTVLHDVISAAILFQLTYFYVISFS